MWNYSSAEIIKYSEYLEENDKLSFTRLKQTFYVWNYKVQFQILSSKNYQNGHLFQSCYKMLNGRRHGSVVFRTFSLTNYKINM